MEHILAVNLSFSQEMKRQVELEIGVGIIQIETITLDLEGVLLYVREDFPITLDLTKQDLQRKNRISLYYESGASK